MEYTTKDFEAYYNGDDVYFDIDEAEKNPKFIYNFLAYVINIKKDLSEAKNYYENYFLDIIKSDYKTIKLLIESFKDDKKFICTIAINYLECQPKEIEDFEICLLLFEILKNHQAFEIVTMLGLRIESYYQTEMVEISKAKDEKNEPNYGYGFLLIKQDYRENPTILEYIAQKMVKDILDINQNNKQLEDLFHKSYKNIDEINNLNNLLLDTIRKKDSPLADYITPKIPKGFFKFLNNNIEKAKNNWQNYIDENNRRKRFCIDKYCRQFNAKHETIFENNGNFYGIYDIFCEIATKFEKTILFDVKITPPLLPNPNMSEDEKLFRNTLEYLFAQAFKDDTFDPSLFAFLEFDNQDRVISIFDADLMHGEKPPKRS